MENDRGEVVLLIGGLAGPVHVSSPSVSRILASPLPEDLKELGERLESTKRHLGEKPCGVIEVRSSERDALQTFLYKAKYERRTGMPLDLSDLEEQLRSAPD